MSSTEKSAANKRIAKKKTANRNIRSIFDNNYYTAIYVKIFHGQIV